MSYLVSTLVFLLIFSLLILIHEWGHFYAARRSGVKVEEFGLGLPPRAKGLFKDKKGTLYSLNWIPFGGFVRMYGENSEDPSFRNKKGSFASKSIAARTLIILGGVLMNFLLGFLLFTLLFTVGIRPIIIDSDDLTRYEEQGLVTMGESVVVSGFSADSPAKAAGLMRGDRILKANAQEVNILTELTEIAQANPGAFLSLLVDRDGVEHQVEVPVNSEGKMGITISDLHIQKVKLPVHEAALMAGYETVRLSWATMDMFVQVLFDLFSKAELSEQVSGPVGIAAYTHQATQAGLLEVLTLIALLSISLGAINVLPIPALDGGRFLSILFELATRKRPNAAWEARIHAFGFILLIILIFAVTYQDIVRLVS